jgi:hypothetical protein
MSIHKLLHYDPYVDTIEVIEGGTTAIRLQAVSKWVETFMGAYWHTDYVFETKLGETVEFDDFELAMDRLVSIYRGFCVEKPGEMKKVMFFRKGELVNVLSSSSLESISNFYDRVIFKPFVLNRDLRCLPNGMNIKSNLDLVNYGEGEEVLKIIDRDYCYQIGCREVAVSTYNMKEIEMPEDSVQRNQYKKPHDPHYRKFCLKHLDRGNGPFMDARFNYELYEGTLYWKDVPYLEPIKKEEKIEMTWENLFDMLSDDDDF